MSGVNARILIWGIAGCGKSTTLQTIHDKLRSDLRGKIEHRPTRLDPSVTYESLAIRLGEVGGIGSEIEIEAVPSAPEDAMTRKQLLDKIDGIILSLDCSKECIGMNTESIDELRASLAAYGQRLDSVPLVIQYNKRDLADPFAIEDLHRQIGLPEAAVFETIATTGHGILSTLTTISKNVVRARKGGGAASDPTEPPRTQPAEVATPSAAAESSHELLEAAILAEGDEFGAQSLESALEFDVTGETQPDWTALTADALTPEKAAGDPLRIVSAGQATVEVDGSVRLPLVLGDESGQTRSVVLSLRLDELAGNGTD